MTARFAVGMSRAMALAAALVLAAACSGETGGSQPAGASVTPHLEDVSLGAADAPVEIVEYSSLSCSHCRDFWKQDFPRLKAQYIDTGKVRFTLKDYPTDGDIAIAGIAIARCKGPDNYYAIMDDVFSAQYDLLMAAREGAAGAKLVEIGARHGVTPEEVRACITDRRIMSFIETTVEEGRNKGVRGTPAVFVNGEAIEDHRYAALSAKIESILNPGAAPAASEAATPVPTTPSTGVTAPSPAQPPSE
jgi:protein-disulfide isomerase